MLLLVPAARAYSCLLLVPAARACCCSYFPCVHISFARARFGAYSRACLQCCPAQPKVAKGPV